MQQYVKDFATFSENGGGAGPAWLAPVRHAAIARFAALGFPTTRDEDWHFTSVVPIADVDFRHLDGSRAGVETADLARFAFGHDEWPRLVFVNGRYAPELSSPVAAGAGVRVLDLASAWREDPDFLERHLGAVVGAESGSFTALNTAFMRDGAVIDIAPNATLDLPIHLVFVAGPDAADGVAHPRNLIVAGHHSRATVIESYVSLGDAAYFTNAVTEIVLQDGARVDHVKVQRESALAFHVGTTQAHQARDSHFHSFSFAIGGALSRTNIYTVLDGPGAEVTLNGLYMADGEQHVDHQTRIEHAAPNTASREIYKGILDGASHGVFNGKVYVQPAAQKTDGKQTNNNLLLSETARIDTKPQLEIFADDVKCTHGATVGRLDEVALFYMRSRGINAEKARTLLTYAFAADVLETIELEPVRDALEALARARFTGIEEAPALMSPT